MKMYPQTSIASYRVLISRCVIGFAVLFLIVRWLEHLLPHQLLQPAIPRANYDLTDWIFKLSGLSYWLTQNNFMARLFSFLLLSTGCLAFIFPRAHRMTILFSLLYFLYTVCFTTYLTHQAHLTAVMVWALFSLWPKNDSTFALVWEGFRYYACWPFASTFLLKVIHGAFWQWDFGMIAAQAGMADYLYHFPDTWFAEICYRLFQHPFLVNAGAKVFMLLEGMFLIGFFTRKYDRLLILLSVLILFQTYLFADVFFAETLVLTFALFPISWWRRIWLFTTPASIHKLFPDPEN